MVHDFESCNIAKTVACICVHTCVKIFFLKRKKKEKAKS